MLAALIFAIQLTEGEKQTEQAYENLLGMSETVERKLDEWKPAKSYLAPPGTKYDSQKDLVGQWWLHNKPGYDNASFDFSDPKDGVFTVIFRTSGCLGGWTLKRTATLKDGLVQLNKAVDQYSPGTFDRLYFVKLNGVLTLIPAGSVEQAKELSQSGNFRFNTWIDYMAYRKGKPS